MSIATALDAITVQCFRHSCLDRWKWLQNDFVIFVNGGVDDKESLEILLGRRSWGGHNYPILWRDKGRNNREE